MRFVIYVAYEKKVENVYRLEGLRLCFSNSASKMGQKRFLHEKVSHGPIGRYDLGLALYLF